MTQPFNGPASLMSGITGPPDKALMAKQMALQSYAFMNDIDDEEEDVNEQSLIKTRCPETGEALEKAVKKYKNLLEEEVYGKWNDPNFEFPKSFDDGYSFKLKDDVYVDEEEYQNMKKLDEVDRECEMDARRERRKRYMEEYNNVKEWFEAEQAKVMPERPQSQGKSQEGKQEKPRAPRREVTKDWIERNKQDDYDSDSDSDSDSEHVYNHMDHGYSDDGYDHTEIKRSKSRPGQSYTNAERDGKLTLEVLKELQVKQTELLDWYDGPAFEKNVIDMLVKAKIDGKDCIAHIDETERCDPYACSDGQYKHLLSIERIKDRHREWIKVNDVLNEPFDAQDLDVVYREMSDKEIKTIHTKVKNVRKSENSASRQWERKCKFALSPKCTSGQFIMEVLREQRGKVEKVKAELSHDPDDIELKEQLEKQEAILTQIVNKKETLAPLISRSEIAPTKKVDPAKEMMENSLLHAWKNRKEVDEGPKTKLDSTSAMVNSIDPKGLMASSSDDDSDGGIDF